MKMGSCEQAAKFYQQYHEYLISSSEEKGIGGMKVEYIFRHKGVLSCFRCDGILKMGFSIFYSSGPNIWINHWYPGTAKLVDDRLLTIHDSSIKLPKPDKI